jgi:hypothetical protein
LSHTIPEAALIQRYELIVPRALSTQKTANNQQPEKMIRGAANQRPKRLKKRTRDSKKPKPEHCPRQHRSTGRPQQKRRHCETINLALMHLQFPKLNADLSRSLSHLPDPNSAHGLVNSRFHSADIFPLLRSSVSPAF